MGVTTQLMVQVAYALGVGVLIGLERSLDDVLELRKSRNGGPASGTATSVEPASEAAASQEPASAPPASQEPASEAAASQEPASEAAASQEPASAPPASQEPASEAAASQEPASEPPASQEPAPDDRVSEVMSGQMGVRTFSILSLLGFIGGALTDQLPFVAPVVILAAALLVLAIYFRATTQGYGITTEVAAVAACGLGMLCHYNHQLAGVLALIITATLASKRFAHGVVRKMRPVELNDTLKFLAAIMIVLPLLPNRTFDPYQAFNPYKTGLLVVLISGISFAGYFLTRIMGAQKGLGLTGVVGGLTSSTAVTAAMADQAKANPKLREICAFSAVAANATMFARVLVVVAVLDVELAKQLAWSVGGMTVVAAACTGLLWYRSGKNKPAGKTELPLKNPFSVGPALKFAAFFVFIMFLLKLAKIYLGDQGLYAASLVSGLADVDAITLSVSEQTRDGQMARDVGTIAIIIAILSNSITKTGIAIFSGGWKFGRLLGACLGLATVVGLVIAVVM